MTILGVDYGRRKIGFAMSEGKVAFPFSVVSVTSFSNSLDMVQEVASSVGARVIVVGVSSGKMGKEQERFAKELQKRSNIQVDIWDETLTTKRAQELARQAGIGRKRRKELEDAFAASVMLQSYLDLHGGKKTRS